MIETLLGGLLGGVFRLAPEVLKWLGAKDDRKHELAMFDKQVELDKLRGDQRMAELGAQQDLAQITAGLEALQTSIKAQGQITGVRWVDALSSSVRPVITYWFMGVYCAAKIALFTMSLQAGSSVAMAIAQAWGEADMALFAGIVNFWFLGRVFERRSA